MLLQVFWLTALIVAWHAGVRTWPQYYWIITFPAFFLLAMQLLTLCHQLWRKYTRSVEVGVLVREAEDAMEEAMREPGDNTLLTRFQGLSHKPTKDMDSDELLEHMRKLHGSHHIL